MATGEGCAGVICKAVGGVNPLVEHTALPRSAVAMGRSTCVSGKSEFGCATCLMRLSAPTSEGAVGEGALWCAVAGFGSKMRSNEKS